MSLSLRQVIPAQRNQAVPTQADRRSRNALMIAYVAVHREPPFTNHPEFGTSLTEIA